MKRSQADINRSSDSDALSVRPSPLLYQSHWRVFAAVDLAEEVRAGLLDHSRRLREAFPNADASWSRAENIHLTLKFFGEVETDRVEKLSAAANRVVRRFSPFQISVTGNGVFPPHGIPRVLWIGVKDPSSQLTNLQQQFESECETEGFKKEERAFRPHLTLARLRKSTGSRTLASIHKKMECDEVKVAVTELLLIRSELSSEGSKYTTISRHSLGSL